MGIFTYLSESGKQSRADCLYQLDQVMLHVNESIASLKDEKGIGTEFLITKLTDLLEDVRSIRRKVSDMPT